MRHRNHRTHDERIDGEVTRRHNRKRLIEILEGAWRRVDDRPHRPVRTGESRSDRQRTAALFEKLLARQVPEADDAHEPMPADKQRSHHREWPVLVDDGGENTFHDEGKNGATENDLMEPARRSAAQRPQSGQGRQHVETGNGDYRLDACPTEVPIHPFGGSDIASDDRKTNAKPIAQRFMVAVFMPPMIGGVDRRRNGVSP